jgi:hypothetical protein
VIDVCTGVIVKHRGVIVMRRGVIVKHRGVIDVCMRVIVKHSPVIDMCTGEIAVGGGAIAGGRLLGVVLGLDS